jgi:HEPN domain-containing protein
VETAKRDWRTVQNMYKTKDYVPGLFWTHLVLEKLIKAHWVKDNEDNHPPKIHNLTTLIKKTKLQLSEDYMDFLDRMNQFQLEGRYPDYVSGIYKIYKGRLTKEILDKAKIVRKCLLKELS